MKTTETEIQLLENQVANWEQKISILVLKHQEAAAKAEQYSIEIKDLREKCHVTSHQIQQLIVHESGLFMWENIGDGG